MKIFPSFNQSQDIGMMPSLHRLERVLRQEEHDYLATNSTWGRVAQKMEDAQTIAWGTGYNPSAPFDNGWGSDTTPSSPPAPKKQKVEHKEESSDDSNVEPKAS